MRVRHDSVYQQARLKQPRAHGIHNRRLDTQRKQSNISKCLVCLDADEGVRHEQTREQRREQTPVGVYIPYFPQLLFHFSINRYKTKHRHQQKHGRLIAIPARYHWHARWRRVRFVRGRWSIGVLVHCSRKRCRSSNRKYTFTLHHSTFCEYQRLTC